MADPAGLLTKPAAAVGAVYAASGFALASWASRLPAVQAGGRLSADDLGLLLLWLSMGMVLSLMLAGEAVYHLGTTRAMRVGTAVCAGGLTVVATHPAGALLPWAAACIGAGNGLCDVAMNVRGAAVGRAGYRSARGAGRRLMPRLHGAWSLGTVVGAVAGAVAAAIGVPVRAHLPIVAGILFGVVFLATRDLAHGDDALDVREGRLARRWSGAWREWFSRRTFALGLLALGAAFAEGTANEWLTVGLVNGYALGHAGAAAGLGLFMIAMTAVRFGVGVFRNVSSERWLVGSVALVLAGTATLVLGESLDALRGLQLVTAVVGITLWGAGAALGVPWAMAAAADDASAAAARTSVVATISYASFLAGPPGLGFLAERLGYVVPLGLAGVVMFAAFGSAAVLHPQHLRVRREAVTLPRDPAKVPQAETGSPGPLSQAST